MYLKRLNLLSNHKHLHFTLMFFVLGLCLLHVMTSQAAGLPASLAMKENTERTDPQTQIPEGLSPVEVDAYLAGMTPRVRSIQSFPGRRTRQPCAATSYVSSGTCQTQGKQLPCCACTVCHPHVI